MRVPSSGSAGTALTAVATLALLAADPPAWAHHPHTVFDADKTVSVSGTVKSFHYTNPHVWIELVTLDASGKPVTWEIEGPSPSRLHAQGWSATLLKTGDKLVASLHPRRDGTYVGDLINLGFANGSTAGNPGNVALPYDYSPDSRAEPLEKPPHPLLAQLVPRLRFGFQPLHPDIVNRATQLSFAANPRDLRGRYSPVEATLLLPGERGRMANYTDAGARIFLQRAQDILAGRVRAEPLTLCRQGGVVRALNQGFTVQVLQSPTQVTIVHMQGHLVRRIHLNKPLPVQVATTSLGYSVGHWEGNTLVVESRGFRSGGWLDGYGSPSSDKLMLIERYSRQPSGSLRIEATINDPVNYATPIRIVRNWAWTPNVTWDEMICEEDNRDAAPGLR